MRKYSDEVYSFVVSRRMYAKSYTEIGDELRGKFGIKADRKKARDIYLVAVGARVGRFRGKEAEDESLPAVVPEYSGWRDRTGYMLGDPPVGRSALDRRM